jgi:NAD(P)-dependent dehydrogenase (short-subunit alcohol dehydrogenase family)
MDKLFDLSNKVALITGGSRGLGRAMVLGFAKAGADVVIASRKLEGCKKVAEEVEALGRRALPISCHVADWSQIETLLEKTYETFGKLDIVVNNAGIAPAVPSLADVTSEYFDKIIGVNLKGPLRLSALAAQQMEKQGGGVIINISTVASLKPTTYTAVYGASKAGLNVLTSTMAQEFASMGIRVNSIVPGTFMTDSLSVLVSDEAVKEQIQNNLALKRIGDPDEIVGTAIYLASDASSYMTGQLIVVDGGALP